MSGESFRRLPVPATPGPALDLALWAHIDATGTATYGGRMPLQEIPAALRFLADHIEQVAAAEIEQ